MISRLFRKKFSERLPVIAGMATMPSRQGTFLKALESILKQVDHMYLFLDRFDAVPKEVINNKITILRSQDYGDFRANGKFLGLTQISGSNYYLTFDDDILYPTNYVRNMIREYSKLTLPSVIGVHASVLHDNFETYNKSRNVYTRTQKLDKNTFVDILGTDSVVIRTDHISFDIREWTTVNMVDINFALECAKRSIPRIAIKRKENWIKELDEMQPDSIYSALLKDDTLQTDWARKLLSLYRSDSVKR